MLELLLPKTNDKIQHIPEAVRGGDAGLGSCFPEQVTKPECISYKIKGSRGMEAGHNDIDPARMELINASD